MYDMYLYFTYFAYINVFIVKISVPGCKMALYNFAFTIYIVHRNTKILLFFSFYFFGRQHYFVVVTCFNAQLKQIIIV